MSREKLVVSCPHCAEDIIVNTVYEEEEPDFVDVAVDFDELMEFMFEQLVELGYVPSFDEISEIIALYNAFLLEKVDEQNEDNA